MAASFNRPEDVHLIVSAVAAGILRLNDATYGGHAITTEQAFERARNIVTALYPVFEDCWDSGYRAALSEREELVTRLEVLQ